MLVKARIIVDGMVQGVGYRAFIKQVARYVGVKGIVRKTEDGGVEIFCDAPKPKIERFLKEIMIKGEPGDYKSVNVRGIRCFWEGEEGYQKAWKEYHGFEIDYGTDELTPFEKLSLEDHEFGKMYFSDFRKELRNLRDETNENFRNLRDETSKNFRTLRDETHQNFESMAEKYGSISEEVKKFRETIEKLVQEYFKKREE